MRASPWFDRPRAHLHHRILARLGAGLGGRFVAALERRAFVAGAGAEHRAEAEQDEDRKTDDDERGKVEKVVH